MKFRSTLLTVLTFLALLTGTVVQAQDDMAIDIDTCFNLSEADCAVIDAASENGIGDASSFTVDINIDFSGSELKGLFELLSVFGGEMDLGPLASMNDATFTLDGTFDIAMDEEGETGSVAGSFVTSFSQGGGEVTEIAADIIVLGDFAYINDGEGWKSIDLNRLSESEAASSMTGMLGMGEEDTAEGEEVANPMAGLDGLIGAMTNLLDIEGFVTYERMGDDFAFTADFTALQVFLTDEYEEERTAFIAEVSATDPMASFMIPALITLFNEGDISIIQSVDTENNIVSVVDLNVNISLDLAELASTESSTDVSLTANLAISNLNGVTMAEAPADAVDATDETLAWIESMMPAEEMEEEASDD